MEMSSSIFRLWTNIACAVSSILVFGLLVSITGTYHPGRLLLQTYEEFARNVKTGKGGLLDYQKLESFLNKNGAVFHYGTWIDPVRFTALRLIAAVLGLLIGIKYGVLYGAFASSAGFWFQGAMLVYLNSRDNEKLLPELKLVYNALAMQIRAGVYVTDALSEVYGSVQDKRLRSALADLSGDIVMKADLDEALNRFQGKFDNRYIDSLCITILQAMESGQAVELLGDITEQIKDMELSVLERKKGALDRSITFYQLGILAAVLTVVLYTCVTHMFTAAVRF